MRLFIAIDYEELKDYFNQLQDQIPKEKLTLTKTYHLTLKFLGEIADKHLDVVKENLSEIKFKEFTLSTGDIGFFPSESYINVVWVGISPHEHISNLQKDIDLALSKRFKLDKRFHPHITLARIKFLKDKDVFLDKIRQIKTEQHTITVNRFLLIKSTLTPEGPVYETIKEFKSS